MSTIINADTSDGLKFTSDTSGEIKLQSGGTDIATVDSSGITAASGKVFSGDGSSLTNLPAPAALSTASGSAPSYSARAWVNFNGTGTVAIRESGNVSSITDNGTGDYTVNFTTAMPDANYSLIGSAGNTDDSLNAYPAVPANLTTTTARIGVATTGGTGSDRTQVCVAIFR